MVTKEVLRKQLRTSRQALGMEEREAYSQQITSNCLLFLSIDSRGNRIGYGLGFYDRFFKELSEDVMKIGLSFNAPMSEELPHEPHDIPLDGCIHPGGITLFENY